MIFRSRPGEGRGGWRCGRAWRPLPAPSRRPRSRRRRRASMSGRKSRSAPDSWIVLLALEARRARRGCGLRHRPARRSRALIRACSANGRVWVWVTKICVTVSPRTASSSAFACASSSGPGSMIATLPSADDVADRAGEGERARIVAQHAPHAGRDLLDDAGLQRKVAVERMSSLSAMEVLCDAASRRHPRSSTGIHVTWRRECRASRVLDRRARHGRCGRQGESDQANA